MRQFHPIALFALAAVSLSGCIDPVTSLDTVTLRAGDAQRANIAIHTVDPQAHRAERTHIASDGIRVARTIEKYRKGDTGNASPPPSPEASLQQTLLSTTTED